MNDLERIQQAIDATGLIEWLLWTYTIIGGLFIIYAFTVFIQTYIPILFRGSLAVFFLAIGTLFLSLAGRISTGYYNHFTVVTIMNSFILAAIGLVFIAIVYKDNDIRRIEYNRQRKEYLEQRRNKKKKK